MYTLDLNKEEFALIRLAVAKSLDTLAKEDLSSLLSIISKFTKLLKEDKSNETI